MEPAPTPGSSLILVPTGPELRILDELGSFPEDAGPRALCGFGPVSAAARASRLLVELRPRQVLLVGIAGTLAPERSPLGTAVAFARVVLDGVGAGTGRGFQPASRMGFAQWDGEPGGRIEEALPLEGDGGDLLTVCAASASPSEALARRERYPEALAEDMEGFGVALAGRLAGVPVAIVRGISNLAGDRERRRWSVRAALAAAREQALAWLARQEGTTRTEPP